MSKLIIVVVHHTRRLTLVQATVERLPGLFEAHEVLTVSAFEKWLVESDSDDADKAFVWLLDDITDKKHVVTEAAQRAFYQALTERRIQHFPANDDLIRRVVMKLYARDTAHFMLPGTHVQSGGDNWRKAWDALRVQKGAIRLKGSLCSDGAGQAVVRSARKFQEELARHQRRVPGGVVICQPNLRRFREWKFVVYNNRILPPLTASHIPPEVVGYAQELVYDIQPLVFGTGVIPDYPWRLDLVEHDGVWYLNEVEVVGACLSDYAEQDALAHALAQSIRLHLLPATTTALGGPGGPDAWTDQLHARGWNIVQRFVDDVATELKGSELFTRSRFAKRIFNNHGTNDGKRLQVKVCAPPWLEDRIEALRRQACPLLHVDSPSVIRSAAGCAQQFWHTDYPVSAFVSEDREFVPLSFMLSLSPYGADLCVRDRLNNKDSIVHIEQGDALMFRGDLVHAGAPYADENLRYNLYFDTPVFDRPTQRTWPVRTSAE